LFCPLQLQNDDGTASTVAIGTAADADAFLAATSVQSTGTTFSGVMTSASADVGTSDVAIIATFTATDGDGTAGVAHATVMYVQNNNLYRKEITSWERMTYGPPRLPHLDQHLERGEEYVQ
jgi:hypothetical protein